MSPDKIPVHHIGPIDGNVFRMKGAKSFWRVKPVTCVRMVLPFIVTRLGVPEAGEAGDYLCEQDGQRWIMPGEVFDKYFAPLPPRW